MKHENQRLRGVRILNKNGYSREKNNINNLRLLKLLDGCCHCCWLTLKRAVWKLTATQNTDNDFAMRRNATFFTLRPRFRYASTPCRLSSVVSLFLLFFVLLLKSQYILQYFCIYRFWLFLVHEIHLVYTYIHIHTKHGFA